MPDSIKDAAYLGDGLYAKYDGYQVWLLASDGETVTDRVALDPDTLASFHEFLQHEFSPD